MADQKQKKMRDFRDDRPHLRSEGLRKSKGLDNRLLNGKKIKKGSKGFDLGAKKECCKPWSMLDTLNVCKKLADNSAFAMAA